MILIAGVGYPNLRDISLGPVLIERLQPNDRPQDVELEVGKDHANQLLARDAAW